MRPERAPSTIERALLGAFIGLSILLCAHAIESCVPGHAAAHDVATAPALASGAHVDAAAGGSPAKRALPAPLSPASVPADSAPAVGDRSHPSAPAAGAAALATDFDDALVLAQASFLETRFSLADGRALVGVMRAQARRMGGVSLAAAAYSYTAIGRGFGVERNDFARTLPDGDVPSWSAKTNAKWRRLRAAVRAVVEGRAGSPCRGAVHLGSLTLAPDVARAKRAIEAGRWRRVQCASDVVHGYFAEVRR